ncbi:hypothetical protein SAMD00019534_000880 [Acytostelium subglobosum LB1]|uniref:hypothetical protein n=1 Tax=Acytostelium subglobosum LB1 TaxID=1410327 RepID=UPI000644B19D|nr:hypothetical protein SAMD00019534_000880 [Acytostelium subglobosum LB1]GAM16913.1 hypothetical protein SAMD00019534_000880 [Acytostelium subglobosum LB1]|eukprot:XP_012758975.1 hypothetical protein SAMD00019534_000880 [Acytostelium subglobosum LB1]
MSSPKGWKSASSNLKDSNDVDQLKQEVSRLRQELKQSNNEKHLLEFKVTLLLDMLALSSLDVKYFEDLEKQWTKKQPHSRDNHDNNKYH